MYYFVKFDDFGEPDSILISECKTEEETENEYYVSKDVCMALKQKMAEKIQSANEQEEDAEQTKDERIAELEAENAALLYQVLTGEELTDV